MSTDLPEPEGMGYEDNAYPAEQVRQIVRAAIAAEREEWYAYLRGEWDYVAAMQRSLDAERKR